jgi:hypothetical protein
MHNLPQTLVIGLGPLGRLALEQFKRRVVQVYGELPAVKLLALDMPGLRPPAQTPPAPSPLSQATEIIDLPVIEPGADVARMRSTYPWLPESLGSYGQAWSQARAAVRLSFHQQIQDIDDFLSYNLHQLGNFDVRDKMRELGFDIASEQNETSLVVLASLGDPVGSALLFDITYLVHKLLGGRGMRLSSTALLYMPAIAQVDQAEQARAYATLKELDHYMTKKVYRCQYLSQLVEVDAAPFNHGCFLIDTSNEKGLNLRNPEEGAVLSGEWLFRTWLTPLKGSIDALVDTSTIVHFDDRDYAAGYASLGYSAYVLPVEQLIEWSARRLSGELIVEHLLQTESFTKVNDQLTTFANEHHLRPDSMMRDELRLGPDGKPMQLPNSHLARLNQAAFNQITSTAQATIQSIGLEMLPKNRKSIDQNANRVLQNLEEAIAHSVAGILHTWASGGLSLANQFTRRLGDDADHFARALLRREAAYQARNQQLVNHLNQLGPALKSAVASVPSIWLIGLTVLAGLLAPLALTTLWTWQGLGGSMPFLAIGIILLVWVLTLAGVIFTIERTLNAIDTVRNQYVVALKDRFDAEMNLALVQAANSLYPDITNAANAELGRLDRFSVTLHQLSRRLRGMLDNTTGLFGEIDFASQKSVLNQPMVDDLYQQALGGSSLEAHLAALVAQVGDLAQWRSLSESDIEERLLTYGRSVFAGLRTLHVEELLAKLAPNQSQAQNIVHELEQKAAPLWTYNAASLGPLSNTLRMQTGVGLESEANSAWRPYFEQVISGTQFKSTNDRHAVVATSVRCGMPLFGLLRLSEFRRQYLDNLRTHKQLLHLEDELALANDLLPVEKFPSGVAELPVVQAFTIGVAYGLLAPNGNGLWAATFEVGKLSAELAADKLESVVLLQANDKLWVKLCQAIQAHEATLDSRRKAADELKTYLAAHTLSPWERKTIDAYIEALLG